MKEIKTLEITLKNLFFPIFAHVRKNPRTSAIKTEKISKLNVAGRALIYAGI